MVTQEVRIRDRHNAIKKTIKILLIIFVILLVLVVAFAAGVIIDKPSKSSSNGSVIVLDNPLKGLVIKNTNTVGEVDYNKTVEEGIVEFNEEYINYLLRALGVGDLHKSSIPPFENPFIEFNLGEETWNSEIVAGSPKSSRSAIENEDLRIAISKEEAVKVILSENIEQYIKDSVNNGNIKIEMIAGKTELFTKGYLEMYSKLTA